MSDESVAIAPVAESAPATIPPPAEPAQWGVSEGGRLVRTEEMPRDNTAVTSEHLGHFEKPATALNADGKLSAEYMAGIKENLKAQRPDPDALPKALKKYGEVEEIAETLDLVDGLYNEPEGVLAALRAVQERSPETAQKIFNLCIAANPALARAQLIAMGELPEELNDPPRVRELPRELAYMIPPGLQQTARQVPEDALWEWANRGEDVLLYYLNQEKELLENWSEQTTRANAQWEGSLQQAQAEGETQLMTAHTQSVEAHFRELEKWRPTNNPQADATLRRLVFAGAVDSLLLQPTGKNGDETWLGRNLAMQMMFRHAPVWRLCGDFSKAQDYESAARKYVEVFNIRLGQTMKAMINDLKGVFKEAPKAKQPPPPDPEPARLDDGGRISHQWTKWIGRNLYQEAR